MRPLSVIVVGVLAIAAAAFWKLHGPSSKSCTVNRLSSAASPNARLTAHVEARTCDEGLKSGLFVMIENANEPGTLYEAFYSASRQTGASLHWSSDREVEIAVPHSISMEERPYADQTVAGAVTVRLKAL